MEIEMTYVEGMQEITNTEDVIDSRDVIARIEYLESGRFSDLEESEKAELNTLRDLQESAEGYVADWGYGETLIRESYFTEYTEEMLKDIGYLPTDLPSWIEIDWEKTADNVRVDYTELEFDGVTYLAR